MREIIKTIESDEGVKEQFKKKEDTGFSLDTDSDDGADLVGMDIENTFIDEKAAAVQALGNIALHCSGLIYPELQTVCSKLTDDLADYFHENVRYHTLLTLT